MSRWSSILVAVVPLFALAACAQDPTELGETEQGLACPKWGCSSNSPILGPWQFVELNEVGLPNEAGVSILSLRKGAIDYRPDVVRDKLVGRNPDGTIGIQGLDLVNARFRLSAPDGAYSLYIMAVDQTQKFWLGPATTIETYELRYSGPINFGNYLPLCQNAPGRLDPEGSFWLDRYDAILYTGDRYDPDDKEVRAIGYTSTANWFNIGCAGGALAKLHLTRHTTAGTTSGFTSTLAARQAMLKMYTSDICGTGDAFTKQGTPLHWNNIHNWRTFTGTESHAEAYWNQDGAMCLDTHRLHFALEPDNQDDEILAVCGALPACSTLPGYPSMSGTGAYVRTRF